MKQFFKIINDETVVKNRNEIVINKDGMITFNPPEEILLQEGWQEYIIKTPTKEEIQQQVEVSEAKQELENSDYKIIKCMEAFLCGEELPYDIKQLHEQRNNHRNKINKYESN